MISESGPGATGIKAPSVSVKAGRSGGPFLTPTALSVPEVAPPEGFLKKPEAPKAEEHGPGRGENFRNGAGMVSMAEKAL